MKRAVVIVAVAIALAGFGCKQQQQPYQGQAPYPGGMGAPFKTAEEIKQLESIAKASPKNANAWIALGNALMDTQRFAEAADAYGKALALDPNNVDVRVDRGTCLRGIGQPEKAIEEYRTAMKINPRHPNAHRNAGVVLAFDLNRRAEAVKEFETYLELVPNAPDAFDIRNTIQQLKSVK